jgi:hypothetical protein
LSRIAKLGLRGENDLFQSLIPSTHASASLRRLNLCKRDHELLEICPQRKNWYIVIRFAECHQG